MRETKDIEWNPKDPIRARTFSVIRSTCFREKYFSTKSCSFYFSYDKKKTIFLWSTNEIYISQQNSSVVLQPSAREITKSIKKKKQRINSGQKYKFIELIVINVTRTFDIVQSGLADLGLEC